MRFESSEFITSAADRQGWIAGDAPEIAVAGRSNVGKSSLINALTRRKKLAKTSSTPGKTQLINFFRIDDGPVLVDLPGYGFAKVPLAVKNKWRRLVEQYLRERQALRGVVVLIDARRG
ncbi:MAG TPA: ribosome biogenesis GTP-binding protein YsxC, partial [Nitrospinae bacterium]|nr:ribosome biogenesis GTP-binding protein YsxC [Nitrospinota bacterium]